MAPLTPEYYVSCMQSHIAKLEKNSQTLLVDFATFKIGIKKQMDTKVMPCAVEYYDVIGLFLFTSLRVCQYLKRKRLLLVSLRWEIPSIFLFSSFLYS